MKCVLTTKERVRKCVSFILSLTDKFQGLLVCVVSSLQRTDPTRVCMFTLSLPCLSPTVQIVQSTRDPLPATPQKLLQRVLGVSSPPLWQLELSRLGDRCFCTPPSQAIHWEGKGAAGLGPKVGKSRWNGREVTSHLTCKVLF